MADEIQRDQYFYTEVSNKPGKFGDCNSLHGLLLVFKLIPENHFDQFNIFRTE